MEESMNKELLIFVVDHLWCENLVSSRCTINNKEYTQSTLTRTRNILHSFKDEIPDWIDMKDKETRRTMSRLPNCGKRPLEFLTDIIECGALNLIEDIDSEINSKLNSIRKLTEDIERLTKLREAA